MIDAPARGRADGCRLGAERVGGPAADDGAGHVGRREQHKVEDERVAQRGRRIEQRVEGDVERELEAGQAQRRRAQPVGAAVAIIVAVGGEEAAPRAELRREQLAAPPAAAPPGTRLRRRACSQGVEALGVVGRRASSSARARGAARRRAAAPRGRAQRVERARAVAHREEPARRLGDQQRARTDRRHHARGIGRLLGAPAAGQRDVEERDKGDADDVAQRPRRARPPALAALDALDEPRKGGREVAADRKPGQRAQRAQLELGVGAGLEQVCAAIAAAASAANASDVPCGRARRRLGRSARRPAPSRQR